ncbi:MAG: hypothetical protein RM347_032685 [Nostoc sp. ChiQUE02]|uniref:hypothetical protein n=1 Tax=Nostoc sp. ChiQUE02 TaxID=3075377 RepID=UPI002AD3493B|nr:hypothetical protein [Nostoc sp. ChiQUE02]MDZ8228904.1 hypothetical protein [Nostoc sp. ChiQUE02]
MPDTPIILSSLINHLSDRPNSTTRHSIFRDCLWDTQELAPCSDRNDGLFCDRPNSTTRYIYLEILCEMHKK